MGLGTKHVKQLKKKYQMPYFCIKDERKQIQQAAINAKLWDYTFLSNLFILGNLCEKIT